MRFVLTAALAAILVLLPGEAAQAQTSCGTYTSSSGRWSDTTCYGPNGSTINGSTWHSSSGRSSDTTFTGSSYGTPYTGNATTWHSSSGRSSDTSYTVNSGGRSYSGSFSCYNSITGRYYSC